MRLLLVHAAATWALVGLIWTIQLVHYRLFDGVGADGWADYHRRHVGGISPLVGPLMLVETATAAWLLIRRPDGVEPWMAIVGAVLVLAIWLSTALWQVPMHNRLATNYDLDLARRLTASNWLRTALWTARGLLALWMIQALHAADRS